MEKVRCCSEFGNIEILTETTDIANPVLVDTAAVLAITGSLPGDNEIAFTQNENKICWNSGSACGTLNAVFSEHQIQELNHANFPWTPSADLANALVLASSACQAAAVSVGLYGIVLEPEGDKLHLLSTNAVALASVTIEKGTFPELADFFIDPVTKKKKVTLRPPVPGIIASFISNCPNCTLDVTAEGIFIKGDWLKAHLPVSIPLEHDLKTIADKFTSAIQVAQIDNAAVRSFITRARALSDKNAFFTVGVKVEAGKLILTHNSIASSSEQWFLAEGINPTLHYDSVPLPADMLMVSLPHIKSATFDYLASKQLVLTGTDPSFVYVVSGGEN